MKITIKPQGVCAKALHVEVAGDDIVACQFEGGCPGNLEGISRLVVGMRVDEVIAKLEGVTCGSKTTSCPDQLAQALRTL
ncbi:MAG: TIGR03905 family TSCPD domain-containing protein [Erysipelotrichaceae bacterium]